MDTPEQTQRRVATAAAERNRRRAALPPQRRVAGDRWRSAQRGLRRP